MNQFGNTSLSPGWSCVPLSSFAQTSSGGTPSRRNPAYFRGHIPWVKSGELGDSTVFDTEEKITNDAVAKSSAKLVPKGTLCIALYGATVGKLGFLGVEATTNQAVCAIHVPEPLSKRFLFHYFRYCRGDLIAAGKGGAQPNISQTIIKAWPTLIPPLPEQHRIVEAIEAHFSRLDAAVAALKRVQANLKRYRASVLKAACEGRLVPTEAELARKEGRDYEPASKLLERILEERRNQGDSPRMESGDVLEQDNLSLPEGWQLVPVAQLGSVKGGKRLPKGHKYVGRNVGTPYIRVVDFNSFSVGADGLKYISPDTRSAISRYTITDSDVYISIAGTIGRVGTVPTSLSGANLTENAAKVVLTQYTVNKYVAFTLGSRFCQDQIAKLMKATTQPKLALFRIETIRLPLPPLAEQLRIVAEVERRLSVVDELEAAVAANLKRAEGLRQAILKRAFEGRLVPTEHELAQAEGRTYETSEQLLARIKATADAQPKSAKSASAIIERKSRRKAAKE